MKNTYILSFLAFTLVLSACEVHQSVNNDLETGAYTRENGIGSGNTYLEINDEEENRNSFVFGEKVKFVFDNVQGLTTENGKVFPGLSMCVVKNETDTVLFTQDLLVDTEEGLEFTPLQLYAIFLATFPYEANEEYKATVNIWDKKGEGTFLHEMPFTIKKNETLKLQANEMTYSDIYLWDETAQLVVVDGTINSENTYILILEGLKGLTSMNKKVFASLSLEILDANGNVLLSNPNVIPNLADEGVDSEQFMEDQVFVTITFPAGELANPCIMKASLTDLNSGSRLDMEAELVVE